MKKKTIDLLTNPFLDPVEAAEKFQQENKNLNLLKKDGDLHRKIIEQAENYIRLLWGSVLRALLLKSLEGDTQALKLLFEYNERQNLIWKLKYDEVNLGDISYNDRQRLERKIKKMIKGLERKSKER